MPHASIILREHNLIIASHQFWVLNINGQPVSELNGMATDSATRQPKPVGSPNDLLKVWEYILDGGESNLELYSISGPGLYQPDQSACSMLEGDFETVVKVKWEKALLAANTINQQDIKYNMFASNNNNAFLHAFSSFISGNAVAINDQDVSVGNSNSVARTLGDIMGFAPVNLSGRLVTGQEKNLLPRDVYPDLYEDAILQRPCRPRLLLR